jgi:Fe-S-cluster containining protein
MAKKKLLYDCTKCLAFCCSIYERVGVEDFDIQRLANHFRVGFNTAKRKFTEIRYGERVLKRQPDPLLGETCAFLDLETRMCTIYEARPDTCRSYPPSTKKCVYYDVLMFERKHQGTDDVIPTFTLTVLEPEEG